MTGPVKAFLLTELGDQIDCLFNPAELEMSKTNTWKGPEVQGKGAPNLAFQRGESGTLGITLMFDTTDTGQPVTNYTSALLDLMKIDTSLGDSTDPNVKTGRPPWVEFHWGELVSFKAVIKTMSTTFTFFSTQGTPLRARVKLDLTQFMDEAAWPLQNPTSNTPDPHSVHQVQAGETLDRIAAVRYSDPGQWRAIAEANHILDPLKLTPGMLLVIPRLEAVSRG